MRPTQLYVALAFAGVTSAFSAPKPSASKSVETIAAEIRPSVVKVMQVGREGLDGLGAGFVVGEDLIATNLHVIGEARRLEIETGDGQKADVVEVTATDAHWDLALLRVARKDLKPLPLANSDDVKQGQPIVAMGNPEGLAFSVVEGVVSAFPDMVNDTPMIRVAVPIEKGNSGGPLLNRQGQVIGLLTLKSARTDNLGFAMPVNELKHLLAKPNPVPMDRWLTIGVLNPKQWKPLLGARWTQHAGIIKAASPGTGFGGRSVCLSTAEVPGTTFEAMVNVKLSDESGAAGVVFCSDGSDKHYGFYPSGGKLRLTRFEGADVYSWTILADVASSAYHPGDWNQLRVRVDPEHITCFVNGQKVIEMEDNALRGGTAGLCKFRNTVAEFRGFRIGADLAEKPLDLALATKVRGDLEKFLDASVTKDQTMNALLNQPSLSRRLMAEKRRALERDAAVLRDLEKELHRRSVTQDLLTELEKPEEKIDLIRCTLLLARHDNTDVDVGLYLQNFAKMVAELKNDPELTKGTETAVKRLNRYLFEENGFHGSRHDYESRSNSYMNEVLDDREGLPITLSVVYLELAARLGIKGVYGMPLPGKFMIGYREEPEGEWKLVDVFERAKLLTLQQAGKELSETGEIPKDYLVPATKRSILMRMLRNLLNPALDNEGTLKEAIPYLNLVVALDPKAAVERITRARLNERMGDKGAAGADVQWLMENFPEDGSEETRRKLDEWLQTLRP